MWTRFPGISVLPSLTLTEARPPDCVTNATNPWDAHKGTSNIAFFLVSSCHLTSAPRKRARELKWQFIVDRMSSLALSAVFPSGFLTYGIICSTCSASSPRGLPHFSLRAVSWLVASGPPPAFGEFTRDFAKSVGIYQCLWALNNAAVHRRHLTFNTNTVTDRVHLTNTLFSLWRFNLIWTYARALEGRSLWKQGPNG